MLLLLDSVLLVVVSALINDLVCGKQCCIYILQLYFFDNLKQNIGIVTAERFQNVAEEDCIKIKTEQHYIQLVRTVKCEQEVSVVCWCVLW